MVGRIFILTGPSGVGKTTVAREVLKRLPQLTRLVTYTTRAPRQGEADGKDYYFISEAEFENKKSAGEFFEWAQVYAEWYGSSKRDLDALLNTGQDVLLVIDVQGAKTMHEKLPHARSIFLQAESPEALVRRLRRRGKLTAGDEARRIVQATREMAESKHCTYTVTAPEGKIEETVQSVLKITRP